MVSVKEIEEDFQLDAFKSDLSEFRPTRILPRYEILFCKGGFPSVFCDRYFDRSKGARGNRGHRNEKGPTGVARRLLAVFLQRRREALRSLFAMWLGEGELEKNR